MRLVVDCETNAIDFVAWNAGDTSSLKTVHCVCALDIDTGEEWRFRKDKVAMGIRFIALNAREIIGFNVEFDRRVMCAYNKMVLPNWVVLQDARRLAKSAFPNGYNEYRLPDHLKGKHSLEAWGLRIGFPKGNFSKNTDWSQWSQEMEDYCAQDVRVTAALFSFVNSVQKEGAGCVS